MPYYKVIIFIVAVHVYTLKVTFIREQYSIVGKHLTLLNFFYKKEREESKKPR